MGKNTELMNSFCGKYLGNCEIFPGIHRQTIDVLFDNGFDCFETLMALDFDEDLPQINGLNLGQKALIRRALALIHEEYERNYFDVKNDTDLKSVFTRIKHKMIKKRQKLKYIRNCNDLKNELDLIDDNVMKLETKSSSDNSCSVFKSKDINVFDIESNEVMTHLNELNESLFASTDDKRNDSLDQMSDDSERTSSDRALNRMDWMYTKASMNAIQYECLKKTVKSPLVLIEKWTQSD